MRTWHCTSAERFLCLWLPNLFLLTSPQKNRGCFLGISANVDPWRCFCNHKITGRLESNTVYGRKNTLLWFFIISGCTGTLIYMQRAQSRSKKCMLPQRQNNRQQRDFVCCHHTLVVASNVTITAVSCCDTAILICINIRSIFVATVQNCCIVAVITTTDTKEGPNHWRY